MRNAGKHAVPSCLPVLLVWVFVTTNARFAANRQGELVTPTLRVQGELWSTDSIHTARSVYVAEDLYVSGNQFLTGAILVSPRPLHRAEHTVEQCLSLNGTVEVLEEFAGELDALYGEFCRLNATNFGSACPPHWTQIRSYSATRSTTCSTTPGGVCGAITTCTTANHTWGMVSAETCAYNDDVLGVCRSRTCSAAYLEIGCV